MNRHLSDFDALADLAVDRLICQLQDNPAPLIALARRRLVQGFDLYPDGPLFKMDTDQLQKESDEETADGIVYTVQQLVKEFGLDQPSVTPKESK